MPQRLAVSRASGKAPHTVQVCCVVELATTQPFGATLAKLSERRLIIVSGKGGVGRTTMAALLGRGLAAQGRRVLVSTTGLDARLARTLGPELLSTAPAQVADNLFVQRLDPATCLREYGTLVLKSERIARGVFDNTVVRRLMRAIPGLDDFSVLGKVWHEAIRERAYDHIIFDGPASGHLMLSLSVPGAILRAVPGGPLRSEASLVAASLQNPRETCAVLVTLPDAWPLQECSELEARLRGEVGVSVGALIINRATLPPSESLGPLLGGWARDDAFEGSRRAFGHLSRVAERQREQWSGLNPWLEEWCERTRCNATLVPSYPGALEGPQDLAVLLDALEDTRDPTGRDHEGASA